MKQDMHTLGLNSVPTMLQHVAGRHFGAARAFAVYGGLGLLAGVFKASPGVAVPLVGDALVCGDPSARLFSSPDAEDTSGERALRICTRLIRWDKGLGHSTQEAGSECAL